MLLGAIIAPTDPVLASSVHAETGADPDRLGFSLAGEGGLNDGTAFPFVMLGLGLLGLHDLGPDALNWWTLDLAWSTLGGIAVGATLGALTGRLVVYLRSHHHEAVGLDVFLGLGLIALANGAAQSVLASGFLAVFAAGLALQRVSERPQRNTRALIATGPAGHDYQTLATHSHHASATMRDSVRLFNGQLEKLAELALVLLVGAMLAYAPPVSAVLWFVPLALLVLRPLSVLPALAGQRLRRRESVMIGWLGIRGVGSVFYLLLALRHGLAGPDAAVVTAVTLWTVATSIVVHGMSAAPLMHRYLGARARRAAASARG